MGAQANFKREMATVIQRRLRPKLQFMVACRKYQERAEIATRLLQRAERGRRDREFCRGLREHRDRLHHFLASVLRVQCQVRGWIARCERQRRYLRRSVGPIHLIQQMAKVFLCRNDMLRHQLRGAPVLFTFHNTTNVKTKKVVPWTWHCEILPVDAPAPAPALAT